jgi:hypothetical protein
VSRRAATLTIGVAVIAWTVAACGGSGDGPASFLSKNDTSAIYVEWTRTGDDVSGSLSTAEVTQPRAQTEIFSTAPPPGRIRRQSAAFTGTVRDDSVRLLIGSGTQTNRVNGRLDGDTLELTLPQDQGVLTRRLGPAGDGDYAKAVRQISDREQQRKAAAKAAQARKQRTDRIEITRVATAFQKALNPASQDDPCRYVTSKVERNVRGFGDPSTLPPCTRAIRDSDTRTEQAGVEATAWRRRDRVRSAAAADGELRRRPQRCRGHLAPEARSGQPCRRQSPNDVHRARWALARLPMLSVIACHSRWSIA